MCLFMKYAYTNETMSGNGRDKLFWREKLRVPSCTYCIFRSVSLRRGHVNSCWSLARRCMFGLLKNTTFIGRLLCLSLRRAGSYIKSWLDLTCLDLTFSERQVLLHRISPRPRSRSDGFITWRNKFRQVCCSVPFVGLLVCLSVCLWVCGLQVAILTRSP